MFPDYQPPRGTPFVLTLAYDLADFQLVRTHWTKNVLRQFGAHELAHELLARVLTQIRADGYVVREYYEFPFADELPAPPDDLTAEKRIYYALLQLDRIMFKFEMPALRQFLPRALLDGTHERHFGNDGTRWTIRFNPMLSDYLRNVAQLDAILPPAPPPESGLSQ